MVSTKNGTKQALELKPFKQFPSLPQTSKPRETLTLGRPQTGPPIPDVQWQCGLNRLSSAAACPRPCAQRARWASSASLSFWLPSAPRPSRAPGGSGDKREL
ncbi:hypothetical protein BOTBODRAFT_35348 [Botryobasidium botryosum FD-172 SS1]|uniref:Uncharacterized protein n=1 Tax=Botryobasidium botryosum (strain FD-172 SS1) TaxID=930990 RepID=A0A067MIT8_BOTB1|nr:hypothetical protein BOTBODRAFT_35348 [Botryobasidium botryosum FD-172 SS1]